MSKVFFWSLFLPIWKQAFTLKNFASGFEKTASAIQETQQFAEFISQASEYLSFTASTMSN